VKGQEEMSFDIVARLFEFEFGEWRIIRTGARDQYVVDRLGKFIEELCELLKVVASKSALLRAPSSRAT
jgi:hypothetical protein